MRKRWFVCFIGSILLVIAACSGAIYLGFQPLNGIYVATLKADADARIPVGSSREQVEVWLRAWRIQTRNMIDSSGQWRGFWGILPNDSLIEPATIDIWLHFDDNGRLYGRSIERDVPTP